MDVIDEDGRLFGLVNVIDALVVLLVLAVAVAGFALLDPFGPSGTEESRFATIDLGDQPQYVVDQIQRGDVMRPERATRNVTVTDVYVGPANGENVTAVVRARINGTFKESGDSGPRFTYAGERITRGNAFTLETDDYGIEGTITRLSQDGTTLETNTRQLAIEATVPMTVANEIAVEDTYNVGGDPIGTIRAVDTYPADDPTTRRVTIGVDIRTIDREGGEYFGTSRVSLGSALPFETDAYALSGTIVARGSHVPAGTTETRTILVRADNVRPDFADGITEGMTEEIRGETTGRIVEKRVEPASVILTSDGGDIFERDHPRNKDVYLTVDVQVRETMDGYQFHARPLAEGNAITLDFRTLTVQGTVSDIRADG
ncbi:DUF4330 family protein [Halorhabdus amylolytica]|uniref:DUF4330 family protein n=1 Tax=Halorhabdus amylolytica TaxID=2559573 RepID=UPI0010AA527E|nr:DUF4330 family protein [Halorhabdus amylolytica]